MRTHRPGEIIDERYVLLRFLGARGGGDVWEAEHQLSGRRVSIKILPAEKPEKAEEEGDEAVLVAEARAVGQIAPHPNIVDIYDLGATAEGAPYLVMEAVEGETLADLLGRKVRIQADDACNIALQILAALETAHAAGVVHGGLSPSGILLPSALGDAKSPEGKGPDTKGWSPRVGSDKKGVKVLDFGMYAERGPTDAASARYVAPERREPRRAGATDAVDGVDARADIFSMGAILFEMLTSEAAFPPSPAPREGKARPGGGAEPPTLPAAITPPHKRLAAMLPSLPAQIVDVIERALQPSLAERLGSAIEMAALLYPFANRATMTSVSPRSTGMPFLSPEARKSRGMARLERAVLGAPEAGSARPEGARSEAARPEPARPEPTGVSREPARPRLVLLDPRANRPLVASNRSERSPGRQPGSAALAHKSAEPRPQSDPNALPSDTSMLSSGVPADARGHSDEPGASEPPHDDDALSSADLMEPRIPRPPRAPRSLASPRLARLRAVMRAMRSRRPTLRLDSSSSPDSTQGGRFERYASAEDGEAGLVRDREDENRVSARHEPGTTVGSLVVLGVLFLLAGILLERLFHF